MMKVLNLLSFKKIILLLTLFPFICYFALFVFIKFNDQLNLIQTALIIEKGDVLALTQLGNQSGGFSGPGSTPLEEPDTQENIQKFPGEVLPRFLSRYPN
jgi:hypothetical protein